MSNVFSLHPQKHPINHLVRIGHTGHKILENLYTAGRAPISHALTQSARAIERLNNLPELRRIDHLLSKIIPETGRNLRKARKIKISDEKLTKRLAKKSDRLDLMHQTLERLNSDLESVPIALSPISNANPVKKAG